MRFTHHSARGWLAAVLATAPLLASPCMAGGPTGGWDDLYVNACNAEGRDSACKAACGAGQPTDSGRTESKTSVAKADKAEPAPTSPVFAAVDDLFQGFATLLTTPSAVSETVVVKEVQSLEVVPAPQTVGPLASPQRLPPAPVATGLNRPIATLTLDAAADPELIANLSKLKTDVAIKDESIDRYGSWDAPTGEASLAPSRFAPQLFSWAAPAVYTNPLYFEQPNLERYGHYVGVCERDNLTQSAISAAHFFVAVPALPYKIGAEGPCECNYVLGSYRPGSCNPHQLVKPPLSLRGLVFEGAAATGLVFFLP